MSSSTGFGYYSSYSGLSSGAKTALGLIFGLLLPCGLLAICCWYRRRGGSKDAGSGTHSRRHAQLDSVDGGHRGGAHTLDLDDPHMEFSVQGLHNGPNGGGGKGAGGRGYAEDGLEEIKLEGDEDGDEERERRARRKKKGAKKGGKKKKRATSDEDVDELELGGI